MKSSFQDSQEPDRRGFLGFAAGVLNAHPFVGQGSDDPLRDFLRPYVLRRQTIDAFLDNKARVWAKFDPEFGYLLRNSFIRDGVDGCRTLARYEATGQRNQPNFPDQPCRINTYGDSFTQGHQVSDGETWQEVLAAHFCEPVRNFGIGGFGVYQAYRRILRNEATPQAGNHIIFNIWGDDHFRSIYSWRWLVFPANVVESMSGAMFHANPWVHARLDEKNQLIEKPSLCPKPTDLYQLTDLSFLEKAFAEDEIVHLIMAERTGTITRKDLLEKAATACGFRDPDWKGPREIQSTAKRILHDYAIQVGMKVVEKMDEFCKARSKRLMILLSYPVGSVWHACNRTKPGDPDNVDWHPQKFKDFVKARGIPLIDSLPMHVAEFDTFKLSAKQYVDRYYIGHYNPKGNHFFAFSIKDALLEWLDPKPPAYRTDNEPLIRFKGYLPG